MRIDFAAMAAFLPKLPGPDNPVPLCGSVRQVQLTASITGKVLFFVPIVWSGTDAQLRVFHFFSVHSISHLV